MLSKNILMLPNKKSFYFYNDIRQHSHLAVYTTKRENGRQSQHIKF